MLLYMWLYNVSWSNDKAKLVRHASAHELRQFTHIRVGVGMLTCDRAGSAQEEAEPVACERQAEPEAGERLALAHPAQRDSQRNRKSRAQQIQVTGTCGQRLLELGLALNQFLN
ncbi:unnamed protein product [Symbiodinium natans]|uniref:Uncharacterized protein n=1 Tax=Symbiodinium natans TaxID=878477 RepID=A0A812JL63_9DINO|nr:unnamed protein product [Symbiodinium natans]